MPGSTPEKQEAKQGFRGGDPRELGRKGGVASGRVRRGETQASDDYTDEQIEKALRKAMVQGKPGAVANWQAWTRQASGMTTNEDILRALGAVGRKVLRAMLLDPEVREVLASHPAVEGAHRPTQEAEGRSAEGSAEDSEASADGP